MYWAEIEGYKIDYFEVTLLVKALKIERTYLVSQNVLPRKFNLNRPRTFKFILQADTHRQHCKIPSVVEG